MTIRDTRDYQLDFNRKKKDISSNTLLFAKTFKKVEETKVGLSAQGLARLLIIGEDTPLKWESAGLIFPLRNGRARHYCLKDILRGLTIEYCMSYLGFRKYIGVRLILELVNQMFKGSEKHSETLDNIEIDKYLMRILNYDIESIAKTRMMLNTTGKRRYRYDSKDS